MAIGATVRQSELLCGNRGYCAAIGAISGVYILVVGCKFRSWKCFVLKLGKLALDNFQRYLMTSTNSVGTTYHIS